MQPELGKEFTNDKYCVKDPYVQELRDTCELGSRECLLRMCSAAILTADLERSESSTMTDKLCNDGVIKRHPCLEVAFKTK